MKLAIFDVDGTLTDTNSVDNECFVKAGAESLGIIAINTNWAEYPHTTDSGITLHLFQQRFGRPPDEIELSKFKSCFVNLLNERYQLDSSDFSEMVGASIALDWLKRESDWAIAIATGCWQQSAWLKLKAAHIDTDGIPAAYAEDGISREEILQASVAKSLSRYRQGSFERIVSIGDGLWDVRAAFHLRFAFLGVGAGDSAAKLRQAGARHVIENFADHMELIRSLDEAEIPGPNLADE